MPGRSSGYAITEQVRTLSIDRLSGSDPIYRLSADQIAAIRDVLRRMIDL
jgi:mRNA interferase MazF